MEDPDTSEETMQLEEQDAQADTDRNVDQDETSVQNAEVQIIDNNTESNDGTVAETASTADSDDVDPDQSCPICMEPWSSSGEHRLCCLRCGHLFGHSCILRWLQVSCSSGNRRCPQCNKKAAVKDIRMLYVKKLTSIDTSELDKLKEQFDAVTSEKNRIEMELTKCTLRQKLYEQQISIMRSRITELENQQSSVNINPGQQLRHINRKFHLERSIDICKDGGCRVIDYNPWHRFLAVSQKSTNALFSGYGIKKIDSEKFLPRQFVFLHSQAIRDITFHSTQQSLLLSVAFDKCAKLMDIQNNIIMHTYQAEFPLWSCCWSGDNPNIFFAGAQNGSITQFDIRQTSGAIGVVESPGDRSPVVSLASVPPNPGSGVSRGGFIACRLNTCYVYEQKESRYNPKQMFLEGPFVSVCYDEKNNHALVSCRPNARQPHARHIVCTIEKGNEEAIMCNVVHTFHAGNSQQLLSRPCHINTENDTLVAAHQESTSSIPLWSIATGRQVHTLPVSDPVVDMCSFEANNSLVLATISSKKLRLYNYG